MGIEYRIPASLLSSARSSPRRLVRTISKSDNGWLAGAWGHENIRVLGNELDASIDPRPSIALDFMPGSSPLACFVGMMGWCDMCDGLDGRPTSRDACVSSRRSAFSKATAPPRQSSNPQHAASICPGRVEMLCQGWHGRSELSGRPSHHIKQNAGRHPMNPSWLASPPPTVPSSSSESHRWILLLTGPSHPIIPSHLPSIHPPVRHPRSQFTAAIDAMGPCARSILHSELI